MLFPFYLCVAAQPDATKTVAAANPTCAFLPILPSHRQKAYNLTTKIRLPVEWTLKRKSLHSSCNNRNSVLSRPFFQNGFSAARNQTRHDKYRNSRTAHAAENCVNHATCSLRLHSRLTKKAEPPPTRDVNRDSGTASANGGWLRRIVRPNLLTHGVGNNLIRHLSFPK